MKQVAIDEIGSDLSGYLQVAEDESIMITRDGQPVGLLIGIENAENIWEEIMLRSPRFDDEIAQARQSLAAGQGTSIEDLKAQYAV